MFPSGRELDGNGTGTGRDRDGTTVPDRDVCVFAVSCIFTVCTRIFCSAFVYALLVRVLCENILEPRDHDGVYKFMYMYFD
jgi:hypothetical protein